MRVRDLGSLVITVDAADRPVVGNKAAAILALLVINVNRRVSGDALMDAAWGDHITSGAASTLLSHIWRLRQLLEPARVNREAPSVLINDDGGYRLIASAPSVDSLAFEQLAGEARDQIAAGHGALAVSRADEALRLWRGRPYGALADHDWATAAVARLDEIHEQVLERRVEALLAADELDRALSDLEPLLAARPFRERLWGLRMLALYRSGRAEESLQAYARVRRTLLDEIGTEPGTHLRELQRRILDHDPELAPRTGSVVSPTAGVAAPRPIEMHLPAFLSPLIGREDDLRVVCRLVEQQPLVMIAGPAGCGKTRLAVEVARTSADRFPDGVWFVDLTAVSDADLVVDVIISAIGFASSPGATPLEELRNYLRARRILLVLDNCEHVLPAVAEVVEVALDGLDAGLGLRMLATSREPLDVAGETTWTVEPLALPGDDSDADPVDAPAVELFLQRVRAHAPALSLDADALDRAVEISRAVDGLPLALELAAARARSYTLDDIAVQVSADPTRLGRIGRGPPDHRVTVRSTIDWSHQLLSAPQRAAHRRLSVLPGPFGGDLAAAVIGDADGPDADELLAQLVHRSMLTSDAVRCASGQTRFAQLATVRAHAHHQLGNADERAETIRRRDSWTVRLVDTRPPLGSTAEFDWHRAVDDDYASVRATLAAMLLDRSDPSGARVATRLVFHWYQRAQLVEAGRWLPLACNALRDGEPVDALLARAALGMVQLVQRRGDLARPHVDHVVAELPGVPPERLVEVGEALVGLTEAAWIPDDLDLFARLHRYATDVAERTQEQQLQLVVDALGATVLLIAGQLDAAVSQAREVYERAGAAGNLMARWTATSTLAVAAMAAGKPADGIPWADLTIEIHEQVGPGGVGMFIETRANLAAACGDFRHAARLYASSQSYARRAAMAWPRRPAVTEPLLIRTRQQLSADGYARAWQDGERLSVTQLVRESRDTG